jgi:hypothetical protein
MRHKFSQNIFEKYSNNKIRENPSCGSEGVPRERTHTDGQTDRRTDGMRDMTKLIVVYCNFAKDPKKGY